MQKELTNAGPLLNERGELCEAGPPSHQGIRPPGDQGGGPPHQGMGLLPDHERKVGCGVDHRRQQLHGTAGLLAAGF